MRGKDKIKEREERAERGKDEGKERGTKEQSER